MHLSELIKNVRNKSNVPWLISSIKLQIRDERDRLKLFAIKNNSAYYWSAYKLSRNRVTQALKEAKSAYYKRQFVSVTNNPKQACMIASVFVNLCKSTGIDKIRAKIIRFAAPVTAESLTKIFNTAIYSKTVPFDWKVARVIPLHKSGPRNVFNNYRPRPVSILSVISSLRKITI